MSYPPLGEYQAAIQNPRVIFKDPQLAGSTVEVGNLGMPRPRSGGFAVTYRLSKGSKSWAVRCFNRDIPDREQRYAAISRFLSSSSSSSFVQFEYLPDEMLVGGRRYPVVKMAWVEGQTLGSYVNLHAKNSRKLADLAKAFREIVGELDQLGVAHGDLQHGNILVKDGRVILIDYDGMFVKGMTFRQSNELGHINYQSPLRTERDFDAGLDKFSSIVIALGLEAIAANPALWTTYGAGGENLLFQRHDFIKPQESALLKSLRSMPSLRAHIDQFELLCRTPLGKLPRLDEFLDGSTAVSVSQTVSLPASALKPIRQYSVLRGTERGKLLVRDGQRIEVVGQIIGVKRMMTKTRYPAKPYVMMDFGDWKAGHFRLMIWSEGIDQFEEAGIDLDRFAWKWVSVTGLLEVFRSGNAMARPQIVVGDPTEIRILAGKGEAEQILSEAAESSQVSLSPGSLGGRNSALKQNLQGLSGAATPWVQAASPPSSAIASTVGSGRTGHKTFNQAISQRLAAGNLPKQGLGTGTAAAQPSNLQPGAPNYTGSTATRTMTSASGSQANASGVRRPSTQPGQLTSGTKEAPRKVPQWLIVVVVVAVIAAVLLFT